MVHLTAGQRPAAARKDHPHRRGRYRSCWGEKESLKKGGGIGSLEEMVNCTSSSRKDHPNILGRHHSYQVGRKNLGSGGDGGEGGSIFLFSYLQEINHLA